MPDEGGTIQQLTDELLSTVGGRFREKLADFGDGGDPAGQIQIHTPHELFVTGWFGRANFHSVPVLLEELVNLVGGLLFGEHPRGIVSRQQSQTECADQSPRSSHRNPRQAEEQKI
jgi:hypothetical protein